MTPVLAHRFLGVARQTLYDRLYEGRLTPVYYQRLRITKRSQAQKILDRYITNKDIQESEGVQKKLNRFFAEE